jgi:hypothetical protein
MVNRHCFFHPEWRCAKKASPINERKFNIFFSSAQDFLSFFVVSPSEAGLEAVIWIMETSVTKNV